MAESNKTVPTFQQNLHLTAQFERGEIDSKTVWAYGIQMFTINLMELQWTVFNIRVWKTVIEVGVGISVVAVMLQLICHILCLPKYKTSIFSWKIGVALLIHKNLTMCCIVTFPENWQVWRGLFLHTGSFNIQVKTVVCKGRQDNVVGIVTRLQAGGSGVWGRKETFLQNIHNSYGAHPVSYWVGSRGSFPRGVVARTWQWPLASISLLR